MTRATPTNTIQPLLLKFRGVPIGTTRLDFLGNKEGVIRLVAIRADYQNAGHGRVLSAMVEEQAKADGIATLFVNAAPEALGYYEKTGYERHGWSPSELVGIAADCIQMRKRLQASLRPSLTPAG